MNWVHVSRHGPGATKATEICEYFGIDPEGTDFVKAESKEGEMTAIANIGSNFVVALPPSDIWLNDSQAAEFLGYRDVHFKQRFAAYQPSLNRAMLLSAVKEDAGTWQSYQTG